MSAIWADFFLSGTWAGAMTKTWTDFTGFTDQAVTASITGSTDVAGNPAPSCDFFTTTSGLSSALEKFRGASTTWEAFGVPAGAVVTTLQVTGFDTKTYAVAGLTGTPTIKMRVVDATTGTTVHAAGELQSVSLTDGVDALWHAKGAGTARTVDAGKQASTTAVKFELEFTVTTSTSVNIDYGFDNIVLVITYAAAAGGGSALTLSLADTTTATDAAAKAVGKAASDSVATSDAPAKAVVVAKTDTVTPSDATAKAFGTSKADLVAANDQAGVDDDLVQKFAKYVNDAATVTDVAAKTATFHALQEDAVTVTDSADVHLSGAPTRAPADTVTVTDSAAVAVGYRLSFSDSVTVSDEAAQLAHGLTLTEATVDTLDLTPVE